MEGKRAAVFCRCRCRCLLPISMGIDGDDEFSMFMQDLDHVTGGFTTSSCRTYKASNTVNILYYLLLFSLGSHLTLQH